MIESKKVDILLVEDNPGDILLTQEAFRSAKVANELYVARDGEEALQFLRKQGPHANAITPDIVLLDLNLPRIDGREVLQEIKSDPNLRKLPVVVLTSSEAETDVARTYDLHVNCYVVKPIDFDKFMDVVQAINNFWLTVVKLPVVEAN